MLRKFILAAALFVLSATAADAASRVWISEFSTLGATQGVGSPAAGISAPTVPGQMAVLPGIAIQATLDISASAQSSAAFNSATSYIRVVCEVQCAVRGDGVTATTSSILLPALSPEYFGVRPGATISVIAAP